MTATLSSSDLQIAAPTEPAQSNKFSNSMSQPISLSIPQNTSGQRSGHLNLDTFLSPVNQNGSFEFDRVLKSGEVYKRTKKTKQWKPCYMVLRPNLLSVYKNPSEARLHKQIDLSDLTAVTFLKDHKARRDNIFGLFSPPRNFYLQANDESDARSWVELIKREARIDEVEQELKLSSSLAMESRKWIGSSRGDNQEQWDHERLGSSSPEPSESPTRRLTTKQGVSIPGLQRPSAYDQDYSGEDPGLSSDFSDTGLPQGSVHVSLNSRSSFQARKVSDAKQAQRSTSATVVQGTRPGTGVNGSQLSIFPTEQDEERVIWHGYLLCLKSKGGVRQWKRHWVVLRPKNLAFYKSKEEYAAHLIIPLSNIISAVEIDPVSKSKLYCMQVIAEEKNYRLCATSEDALAKWLGALKSQLAKKEAISTKELMSP